MDPELKSILTETRALAKDNHRMLRALRRAQVWGAVGKFVFWAVVVLVPLYYLQPYLGLLPSSAELQNLLNQYKLHQ